GKRDNFSATYSFLWAGPKTFILGFGLELDLTHLYPLGGRPSAPFSTHCILITRNPVPQTHYVWNSQRFWPSDLDALRFCRPVAKIGVVAEGVMSAGGEEALVGADLSHPFQEPAALVV